MLLSHHLPLCITGMICAYICILSPIAYDAHRQSLLIWLVRTCNCPFLQSSFFVLFCLLEVRLVGELAMQPLIIDQLSAKVLNPLSHNLITLIVSFIRMKSLDDVVVNCGLTFFRCMEHCAEDIPSFRQMNTS